MINIAKGSCEISFIGITSTTRQKECLLKNYIKIMKGCREIPLTYWFLEMSPKLPLGGLHDGIEFKK